VIHAVWLLVALAALATARLTRLVTDDVIFDAPRAFIQRHGSDGVAFMVTCPWCASIYVSGAVAGVTYAWHQFWPVQIALLALASSMLTGVLAQIVKGVEVRQ
jgi:hypothetical protein